MLFSRSIVWIGKKVITYCLKTLFISISANLVVFCRSVTRLKARAGLAGAGFVRKIASKSHRNRMKNRMCKRAFKNAPRSIANDLGVSVRKKAFFPSNDGENFARDPTGIDGHHVFDGRNWNLNAEAMRTNPGRKN